MRWIVRISISSTIKRRSKWRKGRKRNVKCWYKIEWDKLQFFLELFHAYTQTGAQTNTHTALVLAILNCFWSSTSYAHTFSSVKMVLTYKDYKMACQTMANSKSSSWSFHLLDIIFISCSRIEIKNAKSMHKIKIIFLFLFIHK